MSMQVSNPFERLTDEESDKNTNGCNLPHAGDDARAKHFAYYGYTFMLICLTLYLISLLPSYFDPNENQITNTIIQPVQYYPFPFLYFYIDNSWQESIKYRNMSITNISVQLSNKMNDYDLMDSGIYRNEVIYPEIKNVDINFTYASIDKASTKWIVYNITLLAGFSLSVSTNIFLVIPPWMDNNFAARQKIQFVFKTNGKFADDSQTVLWATDSVDVLQTEGVIDIRQGWGLDYKKFNIKTHSSAINKGYRVYLDFFEKENQINGTSQHYYKTTVEDYYYPVWNAENPFGIPNPDPYVLSALPNYFYLCFSLNPWGGGVKTLMLTQQKDSFLDILAKVGGIFGIVMSVATLIFSKVLIYGIQVGKMEIVPGFAKKVGLGDNEKRKVKRFLKEEGYTKN